MPDIRVLIADDHPVVRQGIRNLIDSAIGMKVIGEANNGPMALQMIEELQPDLVLLDMEMPDLSGVEVIQRLKEAEVPVRVLGLSSYDDIEFITQLLSFGASGYLLKDEVPDSIVEAVRGVARGETGWVSRRVAAKLSLILQNGKEPNTNLTPRELDVLRLVVEGRTNAEIGMRLEISEKTVEKHMDAIFRKMEVASRVEAAVTAVRNKLV
jgi:DNA-binding NarL/FixJ family response regulator